MRIVAAPDKFRGTATARDVAAAVARAAEQSGATCRSVPMSDGGEGMLEAFGGGNRRLTVTGPLGAPVVAEWRLQPDGVAVIESALACGLALTGGPDGNEPETATTRGVGELIVAAAREGARRIVVGLGGSATTDGGRGAVDAIDAAGIELPPMSACCDVTTRFTDAARVFAPQKGADEEQVVRLTERLVDERARVLAATGLDLDEVAGAGAAGGLAGGLAALGAELLPGFEAVAAAQGLSELIGGADLVVTGEGRLDRTSLQGKVVGGVLGLARQHGVPVLAVVGQADPDVPRELGLAVVDLSARYGSVASYQWTSECIGAVMVEYLAAPSDSDE